MREWVLLVVFFTCLFACAGMVLFAVWTEGMVPKPLYFQITATLFVVGLASFLTWFVRAFLYFCSKHV